MIIGVICMAMIANLQYGWTYFVGPIGQGEFLGRRQPSRFAFSIFVAIETWLTPIEGWIVDSLGPDQRDRNSLLRPVACWPGWLVDQRLGLFAGDALFWRRDSGIGAGAIYATCVGNAVKWFPDRRGLAVGLTAAGFGAGAAVTVIPIQE